MSGDFFSTRKKYIFLELRIFFVNSFDAEKADLSIAGIFRAIWAVQPKLCGREVKTPDKSKNNLVLLQRASYVVYNYQISPPQAETFRVETSRGTLSEMSILANLPSSCTYSDCPLNSSVR